MKKNTAKITLLAMGSMIALAILLLCFSNALEKKAVSAEQSSYRLPDTLRVGVLNSPTTYFIYRTTPMGYDYELMQSMADSLNVAVDLKTASNFSDLMGMLEKGEIDLVASPVPVTAEFREIAELCGPTEQTRQLLIQKKGADMAKDVTDLVGHHITVEKDSKFDYRLRNLNSELGGGIVIETIRKDTLVSEDMIRMVSQKEIEMTVVDSDIAALNISDYPDLDSTLALSQDQNSKWAVAKGQTELGLVIDDWITKNESLRESLRKKYFQTSQHPAGLYPDASEVEEEYSNFYNGKGAISPYDHIFKAKAEGTPFDWRFLAAVAYVESRFRPELVSWAGARGLMQVMPGTARAMGFSPERLNEPGECVAAGTKLLLALDSSLQKKIPDPERRLDFILASYNAGLGHILDAIALAEKYGLDATRWKDGVERAAMMKSRPEYYRDPVVKNGYFRGKETVDFVERVRATYANFLNGGKA